MVSILYVFLDANSFISLFKQNMNSKSYILYIFIYLVDFYIHSAHHCVCTIMLMCIFKGYDMRVK